jgi:hypothetical protein
VCRCEDIHRPRRERPLSLSSERPTLCEKQSCRDYETWNGQAAPLKSFVILMANTFPAPGFHHRTRAFQSGYGHPRLTVGLTLDRCSTWERTGKRSIGLTIGPLPQSTANAVLNSKRLYCPSSPASPYRSNLHARITETGVEVLTAGKPREDLR